MNASEQLFAVNTPYADAEIEKIALQQTLTFAEVIGHFDYLGYGPSNEDGKKYFWYTIAKEVNYAIQ